MARHFFYAALLLLVPSGAQAADRPASPCDVRCTVVNVVIPVRAEVAHTVVLTGDIEPKFQSNIAFRINGKISQRLVEVGDHVAADQVLAVIDPQEQSANLDTAKAALASAQALLAQAKVAFQRQDSLFKSGYTTRPSYDQAQQQLRTEAAAVDSAQAALGTAQEQFGYTDLKAGVAGIITARSAETGQVVQAGQTVFTLAQDGPRDAVFNVYEALLTEPPGSKIVGVTLQSNPSIKTQGSVREISPTVDTTSGTVKVKVGLDSVPAGMSLGASIIGTGQFKPLEAIVLPRSALYRWQGSPAVWLLDPLSHVVTIRTVTIERYDDDRLILAGGITPGDTVVSAGIQFLHPGQVVEVAKTEALQ